MKTKEFDAIIDEALEEETRKLIEEQFDSVRQSLTSLAKSFQSISGLVDKISKIEKTDDDGLLIVINGVTPEELVDCCGGDSLGKI